MMTCFHIEFLIRFIPHCIHVHKIGGYISLLWLEAHMGSDWPVLTALVGIGVFILKSHGYHMGSGWPVSTALVGIGVFVLKLHGYYSRLGQNYY